ncbi:MAG: pyridoxal phosphate-dependent aminotransferase [Lactobacillales bacterium]|jgi:cystathionine beta-lyase|nr:pyridoxal phosphate-dependent aminotransferase [Lactobacillales bacterium]
MYNFDEVIERRNTNCDKWDKAPEGVIPMSIADMDFALAPFLRDHVTKAFANNPVLGYGNYDAESDCINKAVRAWQKERYNVDVPAESVSFAIGVVPAMVMAIEAFTKEGDAILINQPVYPPFADVVVNNNRDLIVNNLIEVDGRYEVDFHQFEADITSNNVKLYFLCNPHNPGGRVWTETELCKIGLICKRHNVLVFSDEIWRDIVFAPAKFTSFLAVDPSHADFSIVASAATKTFNIAASKTSFTIIPNPKLNAIYLKKRSATKLYEINILNALSDLTRVAYEEGADYLDELVKYLQANRDFAIRFFKDFLPHVKVQVPEGTYLMWLDFSYYKIDDKALQSRLSEEARVMLNPGPTFGKVGANHARLNFACPRSVLEEALHRLKEAF